eukprot:667446-Amphidinium_carterae.1
MLSRTISGIQAAVTFMGSHWPTFLLGRPSGQDSSSHQHLLHGVSSEKPPEVPSGIMGKSPLSTQQSERFAHQQARAAALRDPHASSLMQRSSL